MAFIWFIFVINIYTKFSHLKYNGAIMHTYIYEIRSSQSSSIEVQEWEYTNIRKKTGQMFFFFKWAPPIWPWVQCTTHTHIYKDKQISNINDHHHHHHHFYVFLWKSFSFFLADYRRKMKFFFYFKPMISPSLLLFAIAIYNFVVGTYLNQFHSRIIPKQTMYSWPFYFSLKIHFLLGYYYDKLLLHCTIFFFLRNQQWWLDSKH